MAVFAYKAMGAERNVRGVVTADTPRQARDLIRDQGLHIFDVCEVESKERSDRRSVVGGLLARAGARDGIGLCRELSTLLSAGIPLLQALDALVSQESGRNAQTLLHLRDQVAAGASLAEAMRGQSAVFDRMCVSVVEVGERAGTLDEVLAHLAEHRGREQQLQGRVTTALIYPTIVLCAGLGVSVFLMTFVVPQLLEALKEAGAPLPLATRIVKAMSDVLVRYWAALLFAAVGLAAGVCFARRNPHMRLRWHRLQLRLPVLGPMLRKQAIARIAFALAILTRTGVEFLQALEVVRQATPNAAMAEALQSVEMAVSAGSDIAPALRQTGVFPAAVIQIVDVGQASGRLDAVLDRLANDYDAQVHASTQRLLAIFEPAVIVALAIFIGFVVLAVILPYLEAGNVL